MNNTDTHSADTYEEGLSIDAVSSVFAHDISTPLAIAKMNADLLDEYIHTIMQVLEQSPHAQTIPTHIRLALGKAPTLINDNIQTMQTSLSQYKQYLNTLNTPTYPQTIQAISPLPTESAHSSTAQTTGPLRILLVDDEDIHHDIANAVLGDTHTIEHAMSGEEAIERCNTESYDIILMDMQMPSLSGVHTAHELVKIIPSFTAIIGLTSMPIEQKKDELKTLGFKGFLEKPLKSGQLEILVGAIFNKKNSD